MMNEKNVKNTVLSTMRRNRNAIKAVDWKNSKWKVLDKYSNVYGSVDWEEGSAGLVWHKSCKVEVCREREWERELQQALDRKKKK